MLADYEVLILFTAGIFEGLTYKMVLPNCSQPPFRVGQEVEKPIGGAPYRVLSVRRVS